ncbi:polysaccharide pyruvyl transferase family protein [Reichenbachiella agariperforans]|uniref:polysaccharide pyruvyl transferase family protein n=1 Tax=Reichenbachiella agariperforans TaxID=156994 RepID=UPI001C0A5D00|nr:polysaccharide pyruvyl transferase family protein [Reichenbachiella agariperforans]MBU2916043.1 polysaccharide pyruvyl transferase family protein [Reichenbachiella agariperforans]
MKYILSNIYSPKNLGDRAIIEGMVKCIKANDPSAEIVYMSKFSYELIHDLKWNAINNIINLNPRNKVIGQSFEMVLDFVRFLLVYLTYKIIGKRILKFIPKTSKYYQVIDADIVLPVGGNYLFSSTKIVSRNYFMHVINILCSKAFDNKVVLFPQSYGPLTRAYERRFLKWSLNKVDGVYCRDIESRDFIIECGVNAKQIKVIPDIAFYHINEEQLKNREGSAPKGKVLVTVLDWRWSMVTEQSNDRQEIFDAYRSCMIEYIKFLSEEKKLDVCIFSQVTTVDSNDHLLSLELEKQINNPRVYATKMENDNLADILSFYNSFDFVVGSRMHSCIFGILQGIPTIGIGYQPKTIGLFNLLGIPNYAFDAKSVSSSDLIDITKRVMENFSNENQKVIELSKSVKERITLETRDVFQN